jgi:antitoxin component of RelBE/YafQ-DinJ toxin-antitoxin module
MGQSVSYRQQGNAVHLTIVQQLAVNGAMPLQLSAPTLPELQAAYPQEVRHYLSPIFVRLFGRDLVQPGAGDVYSVFSEIPPAPQAQAAVQALLGPLDADAFEQRQAASDELGKLGVPGVLAVLRLDRSKLTQEQKSRCDAFVQTQRHRSIDDPQEARRDPNFLIDALNDDDPAVRAAAKSALEAVVGHAIPFDVSQDAATRQTAIAALEEQVQKELAKTPATLPAAQPQPR